MKPLQMLNRLIRGRGGNALVTALIAAAIITGIGVTLLNRSTANVRQMQQSAEADQTWYIASAGIEHCLAKLRWEDWFNSTDLTVGDSKACQSGNLAGGSYTVTVTKVNDNQAHVYSSAEYSRFKRTLVGIVNQSLTPKLATEEEDEDTTEPTVEEQLGLDDLTEDEDEDDDEDTTTDPQGNPYGGNAALYGGGDWYIQGNSKINGNLITKGSIHFSGSAELCGIAVSGTQVTWGGSAAYDPDCEDSDSLVEPDIKMAFVDTSPAGPITVVNKDAYLACSEQGNSAPNGWESVDCNGFTVLEVRGKLKILNKGVQFNRTVKIIADSIEIEGGVSTVRDTDVVYLHSMGGSGAATVCTASATNPQITVSPSGTYSNVIFYAPNGTIDFNGSMAGGGDAGVYGAAYARCVQVGPNWNFYAVFDGITQPGEGVVRIDTAVPSDPADGDEDDGTGKDKDKDKDSRGKGPGSDTPGTPAPTPSTTVTSGFERTLRLTGLYEPQN